MKRLFSGLLPVLIIGALFVGCGDPNDDENYKVMETVSYKHRKAERHEERAIKAANRGDYPTASEEQRVAYYAYRSAIKEAKPITWNDTRSLVTYISRLRMFRASAALNYIDAVSADREPESDVYYAQMERMTRKISDACAGPVRDDQHINEYFPCLYDLFRTP